MFESLLIIAIILSFLSIPCNVPDGAVYMSFSMPKKYTYYVRGQGNAHHGYGVVCLYLNKQSHPKTFDSCLSL